MNDRVIALGRQADDLDAALRPKTLAQFIGQKKAERIWMSLFRPLESGKRRSIMFYWRAPQA